MKSSTVSREESIIDLNVGGEKFSTSKHTLTWIPDTFFTSLLSGRISTIKDSSGAIFIDRDPKIFAIILNYLRTKQVNLDGVNVSNLRHEAQFYGLGPLVKRLMLCEELDESHCGDVLFHGFLPPPPLPQLPSPQATETEKEIDATGGVGAVGAVGHSRNLSEPPVLPSRLPMNHSTTGAAAGVGGRGVGGVGCVGLPPKFQVPSLLPEGGSADSSGTSGSIFGAAGSASGGVGAAIGGSSAHNRASSADYLRLNVPHYAHHHNNTGVGVVGGSGGHHKRGPSADLTRMLKEELSTVLRTRANQRNRCYADPLRVRIIRGHHNWVAVGYSHFVSCYRMKESFGWQLAYVTPRSEQEVCHIALNAKFGSQNSEKMLAAALDDHSIHLWSLREEGGAGGAGGAAGGGGGEAKLGVFTLGVPVDTLFWIGSQLVGLSRTGKVGIRHGMTENWQVQDVLPISAYDTAGSALLLGCTNGSIYYIDMQKFPLRMKDNDLLVTELYRDPSADVITSISVYLTPKTNLCGNWIEIAYGTSAGSVRVIVQHPETVGHGPQLFQTFTVHRAPITKVALTTYHLIAVCSEYNHVRSWVVTRFRGMISTQPGSTPLASFKALTLESADGNLDYDAPDVGPFGDQDGEQVFIQKIVPDTNQLFVRLASNGDRVCVIKSVDGSSISSYLVHECEGSSRMGSSRPRRYLFTGHSNGTIQMWDLTTALDAYQANKEAKGCSNGLQGPSAEELLALIDECEITCSSLSSTPGVTPAPSVTHLPSNFN